MLSINNANKNDKEDLELLLKTIVFFILFQFEKREKSGTKHIQEYFRIKKSYCI